MRRHAKHSPTPTRQRDGRTRRHEKRKGLFGFRRILIRRGATKNRRVVRRRRPRATSPPDRLPIRRPRPPSPLSNPRVWLRPEHASDSATMTRHVSAKRETRAPLDEDGSPRAKSRGGSPFAAVADETFAPGAPSKSDAQSHSTPPSRTCRWIWSARKTGKRAFTARGTSWRSWCLCACSPRPRTRSR